MQTFADLFSIIRTQNENSLLTSLSPSINACPAKSKYYQHPKEKLRSRIEDNKINQEGTMQRDKKNSKQIEYGIETIDDLVPLEHLLKRLGKV